MNNQKNVQKVQDTNEVCSKCKQKMDKIFICQYCFIKAHENCFKNYFNQNKKCLNANCKQFNSINQIVLKRFDHENIRPKNAVLPIEEDISLYQIHQNSSSLQHQQHYDQDHGQMYFSINQVDQAQVPQRVPHQVQVSEKTCKDHPQKLYELYCAHCNMLFCNQCRNNHSQQPHTCIKLSEIPFEDGKKKLLNLTGDISTEVKQSKQEIEIRSKKLPSILPFCIEVDSRINSIKSKMKKKVEEENDNINKCYDDLQQKLEEFKNTTSKPSINEPQNSEYMKKIAMNFEEQYDEIDKARMFNSNKILNKITTLKEIMPPYQTASFAISLPNANIRFIHKINIYYTNWQFILIKEEKSQSYSLTLQTVDDKQLPQDFKCNVSFEMKRTENNNPSNQIKVIEVSSNMNKLCSIYFPEYFPQNVGKLYIFIVGIQPSSYNDLARLHDITFQQAAENVPEKSNNSILSGSKSLIK